jgi:cytochrome P450
MALVPTTWMGREVADKVSVGYDHMSSAYVEHADEINRQLATECPVAWTDSHGGFWAVTGYNAVKEASIDDVRFSSWHDMPDGSTPFRGVDVPGAPIGLSFLELDPPQHKLWRNEFNSWFTPEAVKTRWAGRARELSQWCIDRVIERGSMEVIEDLAGPVPAIITLELLGLPLNEWYLFSMAAHNQIATEPGSPEHEEAQKTFVELFSKIPVIVAERRKEPRGDLFSAMTQMTIDGKPLTDQEIIDATVLIISGGVDTTTNLIANSIKWLAEHEDERRRLIADRGLLKSACEEFARYFSPVTMNGRTVTQDTNICGTEVDKHDRILISWAGANLDPSHWEDPETVKLDRSPNRHLAFGLGVHRCVGSHLARALFAAMMEALLTRIPDYVVDGAVQRYESIGHVNGVRKLPIRFAPGQRTGLSIPELDSDDIR